MYVLFTCIRVEATDTSISLKWAEGQHTHPHKAGGTVWNTLKSSGCMYMQ